MLVENEELTRELFYTFQYILKEKYLVSRWVQFSDTSFFIWVIGSQFSMITKCKKHGFLKKWIVISFFNLPTLTSWYYLFVVATSYYLVCGSSNMTLAVERHAFQGLDLNNTNLNDADCKAIYNDTHVSITAPLKGCGTKYSETDRELFFSIALNAPTLPVLGTVITRKPSIKINFRCAYNRLIS